MGRKRQQGTLDQLNLFEAPGRLACATAQTVKAVQAEPDLVRSRSLERPRCGGSNERRATARLRHDTTALMEVVASSANLDQA